MNQWLSRFTHFMETHIQPYGEKMEKHPYIIAIREGFILALPFLIVGSFMLILLFPPFDRDTTFAIGQAWWNLTESVSDPLWRVFQMSFNSIALFVSATIAYKLAKAYKREPMPAALLSVMTFLLVCGPYSGDQMTISYMGGSGLIPAMFIAFFTVELTRLLEKYNICFRLPKEVPSAVADSLNMIIPMLAVVITIFPAVMWFESNFGQPIPQLLMDWLAPLVKASDSMGAIVLFSFVTHLLLFCGIPGSLILMQLWTPFLITNMTANLNAMQAGEEMMFIVTNSFWDFYIVHGATGGLLALTFLLVRSRSVHMRSIGRIGIVPAIFSISDPVYYGLPMLLNPTFFIPLILAPVANAVVAYAVVDLGLVGKMFLMAPWTTPAPIGAFLTTGGDYRAIILSVSIIALNVLIYYPFFKMFEKQCLAKEAEARAKNNDVTEAETESKELEPKASV
ncbi:PTS sugar transporter subunit IIC [Photobacterium sanctipauli]|uniref:Permease IIC component n=2 Tax=Photobacterium sanctipauli TaxID=1342794 RepID=A0A2T3NX61_9GAMM|nr:PTS transporter subunit EIIC [Photobacterium sanctipauli]PSW20788.1 PTS sugar transporter subunit IIC [Photobacterium sanctipauli]